MTEQKSNIPLESQLHDLYTTPEPNPAFTRRLRAQMLEQAAQRQGENWTTRLWRSVTSAGRFTFGLAGAALLITLVLAGGKLLAGQYRAPEPGSASPLAAAPTATAAKSPSVYNPPQLAPSVCETLITPRPSNASLYRPGKLIGGGVVKSGDFQINLYLFCDPSFRPERDDTYSEIAGLGIYQSFWYNGPDVDEPESRVTIYEGGEAYTQIIPAVALQRGSKMSQKSGIIPDPSAIPDWSASGLPMRYLYIIRGAQGKLYGATLSFRLVNSPFGFQILDIKTESLSGTELAQLGETVGFMPTYPTISPESLHPLLGELKAHQDQLATQLFDGAGWIHNKMQWKIAGDSYAGIPDKDRPSLLAKDYFSDIWYKVGENGAILGIINRQTRPDERYGETILREESYIMPKAGLQTGPFMDRPTFDDGVFNSGVDANRHGGTVSKQKQDGAVQYTITTANLETQAVFDPQTGLLREVRYYTVEKDGKWSLYSTGTTITLERTDEVPMDILRYFQ